MMRDFSVFFKGTYIGVFRDYNEAGAISQAKMKVGNASKYSSVSEKDFVAMKVGLL